MNITAINRTAAAINALRPDWPVKSLATLLARPELGSRDWRDVTLALAYVACDPASVTPARVLESGPWWTSLANPAAGTPAVRAAPCPEHGTGTAIACPECAAEFAATDVVNGLASVRTAIRTARTTKGVTP